MRIQILKKLIISSTIIFFTIPSFAESLQPGIVFETDYVGNKLLGEESNNDVKALYGRNWTRENILKNNTVDKSEKIVANKYYLYFLEDIYNVFTLSTDRQKGNKQKAVYIFNKTGNESIGWCLMDSMLIGNLANDPVILQIKSLEIDNDFFNGEPSLPPGASLIVYEKDHGAYIERYAIGKYKVHEVLVLDSFYPKDAEKFLKPFIRQEISANMRDLYDALNE